MVAGSKTRVAPAVYEPQRRPGCRRESVPFLMAVVERQRIGTATTVWYGCGYTWNTRRQALTADPACGCSHL